MADQLQIRGGDTASNSTFTGAQRELSIDTSKNQLIVHDGATPGGHPIPTADDPVFTGDADFDGSITAGGAATFADVLTAGESATSDVAINYGAIIYSNAPNTGSAATLWLRNTNPNGGKLIYGANAAGNAEVFSVTTAGGADFVSYIQAGLVGVSSTTNSGGKIFGNGVQYLQSIKSDIAATTDQWRMYWGTDAVITFQAQGSASFAGNVSATVVPPSDARFKENIEPAKPQLADVVALGGLLKNYDWNDQAPLSEELRSQRQLGLIAQEAAEVCPSIVKDINRTKTVEVKPAVTGPKGRVITEAVTKEEDDSYKGISTDALIMKMLGAIAELSAEVAALKAKRKG